MNSGFMKGISVMVKYALTVCTLTYFSSRLSLAFPVGDTRNIHWVRDVIRTWNLC